MTIKTSNFYNSNKMAIVWVAIPRTGTNFLCSLLKHHPLITSYYEIFHQQKFYAGSHNHPEAIIQRINQKYATSFLNLEDRALIEWIHHHPDKLIDLLLGLNPEKYVSFKLFPNQLTPGAIKSTIINNQQVVKILVKRDLLATYISHEIAFKINKWDNFDTSQVRVTLSVEKFANWVDWAQQWYQLFEKNKAYSDQEYFVINYEDIHIYRSNTDKLAYIDRFLKTIGLDARTKYQLPNLDGFAMMQKQDSRQNIADKIINYQEFIEQVKERGLYQLAKQK